MFDVLVYLFENFYQTQAYPDQETLTRKLAAAGFENDEIHEALDWLDGLAPQSSSVLPEALITNTSFRGYAHKETGKLSVEARGFLVFLESAGVLSPLLREIIIERAMALPDESVGLEQIRVIALMVLWTRKGNVDALVLDELLPDGEKRRMH